MLRQNVSPWVSRPILGLALLVLTLTLLPHRWDLWLLSESGPVELGTAALFVAAAVAAVKHVKTHREQLPRIYRVAFGLFAAAALFVALEELSYGQHLLSFRSPEWFQHHNKQNELNLHNLYGSSISRRMRLLGSIAIPAVCIILPLIYRKRPEAWTPNHWTHFLLPGTELITLVVLAQLVTVPNKLPEELVGEWSRLGEIKELYWAVAAYCYIRGLSRRQHSMAHSEQPTAHLAGTAARHTAAASSGNDKAPPLREAA